MPLIGIPKSITPELLYTIAKMGHGDRLVIADANFPSDSIAINNIIKEPIRITGISTSQLLIDILKLFPLDTYDEYGICVMNRVSKDIERGLNVPAYELIASAAEIEVDNLNYIERFNFYELAKNSFCVVQTDDSALYANIIISKGVIG